MTQNLTWQIGALCVTRIQESQDVGLDWVLENATAENLLQIPWLAPHFMNENGEALWSIHALVVETPSRRILVDTCVGNDKNLPVPFWNQLQGSFLEDLAEAGFPPDSIDIVLCTHLHVDHVGWNTTLIDGKWQPTFPNARYLFARDEWTHWESQDDDFSKTVLSESVRPIWDAGLVDLVDSDHRVCDEVWFEPSPGHTPGHVSIRLASGGHEAVITGDMIHHPCQFAHPGWGSPADVDFDRAVATREAFFARNAAQPILVIGTHFATPTAGHVVRDGDAYRLEID